MSKSQICRLEASVECDTPNDFLYRFEGTLVLNGNKGEGKR